MTLGEVDFGGFMVITNLVLLLYLFRSACLNGFQRFITYFSSIEDDENSAYMSASVWLAIIISCGAFFLFILSKRYILNYINIESFNSEFVNTVYILMIVFNSIELIKSPFIAKILSEKKFYVFSIIGIFEHCFKLTLLLILVNTEYLSVITWSYAVTLISLFSLSLTVAYVRFNSGSFLIFSENRIRHEMLAILKFIRWRLLGSASQTLDREFLMVVSNNLLKSMVNASMAVAFQLSSAFNLIIASFHQFLEPTITKMVAEKRGINDLIYFLSHTMNLIMVIGVFTLFTNFDYLLGFWIPILPYKLLLVCIVFVLPLILEGLMLPLWTVIIAHGDIKKYQKNLLGVNLFSIILILMSFWIFDSNVNILLLRLLVPLAYLVIRIQSIRDILGKFDSRKLLARPLILYLSSYILYLVLDKNIIFNSFRSLLLSIVMILSLGILSLGRRNIDRLYVLIKKR